MTASATIYIQEKQNTLVLSGKAMRFTPDTEYMAKMMKNSGQTGMPAGMPEGTKMVWMKDEKSGIRPVPVTVGIENGSNVEILSGLKEGDEVIISMTNEVKKATTRINAGGPGGPPMF
jgi:HlyD family secretion protein